MASLYSALLYFFFKFVHQLSVYMDCAVLNMSTAIRYKLGPSNCSPLCKFPTDPSNGSTSCKSLKILIKENQFHKSLTVDHNIKTE